MEDIAPVYLEKIKGARVVYYQDGHNPGNKVSEVLVGLVFAVLCTLCPSVWDRTREGQSWFVVIAFSIVLSRVLVFTYRLSKSVSGTTGACTCDHQHNDTWRIDVEKSEHGDGLIEAGTVVNWGIEYASGAQKFHGDVDGLVGETDADTVVDDLLLVQWDCGYRKVYSKIKEWKKLRVFDMGPTGMLVHLSFSTRNVH